MGISLCAQEAPTFEEIDFNSERSVRTYFDKNGTELIEGVWELTGGTVAYRLAIIKRDF